MFHHPKRRRIFAAFDPAVPSMTEQSHKAECDIHNILAQYRQTGVLRHIAKRQGQFLDLPDPVDFQESIAIVSRAQEAFDALPSSVRDEFRTPQEFLAAFYDSTQADRLRELGLLNPAPEVIPPVAG